MYFYCKYMWEIELCRNTYGQIFDLRSSKILNAGLPLDLYGKKYH